MNKDVGNDNHRLYYLSVCCVFLVAGLFFSCKLSSKENENGAYIRKDIQYGDNPIQNMDVYLIANRTAETPLVVLVHGGGWMNGDKRDADFMKDACFNNNINVVNINYRLASPDIHYEEIMSDINSAMSYVLEHAGEWNIRKDKFIFWGGSAGGHLSLLYAYNYDHHEIIAAVITLGAPTRFDDVNDSSGFKQTDLEGLLPLITGKPWSNDSSLLDEAYKHASPYYGKKLKPTLLVHGELDNIVPQSQAKIMHELLLRKHVASTLFILPNGGHAGENTTKEVADKLNQTMYEWMIKYSRQ